tara:strand:- start:140 stop:580 length:441 start_codon:yes stop_codon:yes gene_type:complete
MSRLSEYLETYEERPPRASNQFADRQKDDREATKFGEEYGQQLLDLIGNVKIVTFYVDWRTALSFGIIPKTPVVGFAVMNLEKTCTDPLDPAPEKLKALLRAGIKAICWPGEQGDMYLGQWEVARKVANWLLEDGGDSATNILKIG